VVCGYGKVEEMIDVIKATASGIRMLIRVSAYFRKKKIAITPRTVIGSFALGYNNYMNWGKP
jgi:hypothetical protein